MQQRENLDLISPGAIGKKEGNPSKNEFARFCDPSGPAEFGIALQQLDC